MTAQDRDDQGRFTQKVLDQDILKAFDFEATAGDPFITVSEISEALSSRFDIEVSDEAVRERAEEMTEGGSLARREFGPSVAYRALVGPELAADIGGQSDAHQETQRDEFVEL
ncbi:MAG: helix-turn-helix domain-containing protein [Halobacteriales archaeon]